MGSTTVSNRDDLQTNCLLIKENRVMVLGCTLSVRYTTAQSSTMKHLRPLRSTAKSFHQATPDPYSHIYKHTHTHKNIDKHITHTDSILRKYDHKYVPYTHNILYKSTFNKIYITKYHFNH